MSADGEGMEGTAMVDMEGEAEGRGGEVLVDRRQERRAWVLCQ